MLEPTEDAVANNQNTVAYRDVVAAAECLQNTAHRTLVATSRTLDDLIGAEIFFKCENLQRTGSFKFRGAFNALANLSAEQKRRGVITYSSGNHAQAVALAGQILSIPTTIVMPQDAPAVKLQATRGYGGDVITYDKYSTTRESLAAQIAGSRGLHLIPPYDHPHVIAGQGTAVRELLEDVGPLDILLVPCGGGGLLSGSAISAEALSPSCRVIGVEPAAGDDATRSFKTGILQTVSNPETIADGARTPSLGTFTFPLVLRHVDDMVTVTDEALVNAMFFLWERMKLLIEPTGALAFAALFDQRVIGRGRVGVLLSGGNVELAALGSLIAMRSGGLERLVGGSINDE